MRRRDPQRAAVLDERPVHRRDLSDPDVHRGRPLPDEDPRRDGTVSGVVRRLLLQEETGEIAGVVAVVGLVFADDCAADEDGGAGIFSACDAD